MFLLFIFLMHARASIDYNILASGQTRPISTNIVATVAYNSKIWGEEKPLYGFYRVGLDAGGSPTFAGFAQVSPIAPLVFTVERSTTFRYFQIHYFDCVLNDCYGRVDRTDYAAKLGLGFGNFLFSENIMAREIQTPTRSKTAALELENFIVPSGYNRYLESTLTVAYKLKEKNLTGIIWISGKIQDADLEFDAVYAFYRFNLEGFDLTAGAGNYRTSQPAIGGPGIIALISKSFGETLSLF